MGNGRWREGECKSGKESMFERRVEKSEARDPRWEGLGRGQDGLRAFET